MTQREHDYLTSPWPDDASDLDHPDADHPDADPHTLLFGPDDGTDPEPADGRRRGRRDAGDPHAPVPVLRGERRQGEHAHRRAARRRGRLIILLTVVLVAVVGVVVVPRMIDYFRTPDWSGEGSGSTTVTIPTGASAGDIADILHRAGVVRSARAFTDAAKDNSRATAIQPGSYTLHQHMSGAAAVTALLDPASRNRRADVVVPEGATSLDVTARLGGLPGGEAAVRKALADPADLGIPVSYKTGTAAPPSAEGFLYPATYTFDPGTRPSDALSQMVAAFIRQDRSMRFTSSAGSLHLTPYQALTIASIAQSEAKFPADMPKVVRTILNRLHADRPLQFDSTSSYGAKLQGLDPAKVNYSRLDSPYNTYTHKGLPPTPIDNPGAEAMQAVVHPASGTWLYFVNRDAAGHLFFTADEKAFAAAAAKCAAHDWGCG